MRRNYIINPVFQWKYTALVGTTVFAVSTTISVIVFAVLHGQARARVINPMSSTLWENTLIMIGAALAFGVVTAGSIGFWSVFATHRIAGPLHVLQGYFKQLEAGRFPVVRKLRKKDEFQELHRSFSSALEALQTRQNADRRTIEEAIEIARRGMDGDASDAALNEITQRLERLLDTPAPTESQPEQDPQHTAC